MKRGIKNPRGPGETAGEVSQEANHENKYIISQVTSERKGVRT